MAQLRTLEDFINQRLRVDGRMRLHVFPTSGGRYQANLERVGQSNAWAVEIDDDPVTAIWNLLVPLQMRRRLPSGRDAVIEGELAAPKPAVEVDEPFDLLADLAEPEILDLLA